MNNAEELAKEISEEEKKANEIQNLREEIEKNKSKVPFILARYFLAKYEILTLSDNNEIFVYYEGIYGGSGDKRLAAEAEDLLGELCSSYLVNETLAHIRRSTYKSREEIQEPEDRICLANGVLNFQTMCIENHSPEYIFFNKLPVHYAESTDCPKIKKFLKEVVTEADVPALQELAGYCLFPKYPIHKAILLTGTGANGKSTFLRLLKNFLGSQNCASIPLQQLENNRFAPAGLFGKMANICADLSAKALLETGTFKMATGQDLLPGERKFEHCFFFENKAKLIFSCNYIPRSPDDSDGFFRRWLIVDFPNKFVGKEANQCLINTLTTPEELSGFLNFSLEGLKRLLQQQDFSNAASIERTREVYLRKSDSVASFRMDRILVSSEDHVPKKLLYTEYTSYCREMGYPAVPENTFHRHLQKIVRIEDYRPSLWINGKQERIQCWKGIKINTPGSPDKVDLADNADVNKVNDVNLTPYLKEEAVEDGIEWTEAVSYYLPCSAKDCGSYECKMTKEGRPLCQEHWKR
ncbi:hypothetical protein HYU11_03040 [Candidatus Woesearchaeota archaeon]|nr:hypothetical protein [Candidatus Woesearchaeota archaeon]